MIRQCVQLGKQSGAEEGGEGGEGVELMAQTHPSLTQDVITRHTHTHTGRLTGTHTEGGGEGKVFIQMKKSSSR